MLNCNISKIINVLCDFINMHKTDRIKIFKIEKDVTKESPMIIDNPENISFNVEINEKSSALIINYGCSSIKIDEYKSFTENSIDSASINIYTMSNDVYRIIAIKAKTNKNDIDNNIDMNVSDYQDFKERLIKIYNYMQSFNDRLQKLETEVYFISQCVSTMNMKKNDVYQPSITTKPYTYDFTKLPQTYCSTDTKTVQ